MSKSKIVLSFGLCFAFGVFLASVLFIDRQILYIFLAIFFIAFFLFAHKKNRTASLIAVFLIAVLLGALRMQISNKKNEFQNYFDSKVQIRGIISQDIDLREGKQNLTVLPNGASQQILITDTLAKEYFYGDELVITGKISEPKNFEDFNYEKYLERYNIYALMRYPQILILKNHQGNFFKDFLLQIKNWFTGRLYAVLPPTPASLLAGILLGARRGLPESVVDNFNITGISHILAISGYNITIIVVLINSLAKFIGRKQSFYLGVFILVSFIILTGGSASVIRASIMGFMLLVAGVIGRQHKILPGLIFAGVIMLIQNPKILFFDVGFQLSFMATLGIVLLVPEFEKIFKKFPDFFGAKELLLSTLAAIIATLPLILWNFGRLSLIAPVVNLLVLPIIPATMAFGSLSALPILGPGFALPAKWLLNYLLEVSAFFARLPFASLNVKISSLIFGLLIAAQILFYLVLKKICKNFFYMIN